MKVVHRSDRLLVLEDQPWILGAMLILMAMVFLAAGMALASSNGQIFGGLMLALVGGGVPLGIAALMVQRVRLTLDRTSRIVTRTRRSVLGLTQTTYDLGRVERARVGASTDSDGTTYRMELDLRAPVEILPFTSYHTSGQRPHRMAEAVNDWLAAQSDAR